MRLVLASKSPRRVEILKGNGYDFLIKPQSVDENLELYFDKIKLEELTKKSPEKLVMFLAKLKAKDYSLQKDEVILSCDTIVWHEGKIFGKPKTFEEAKDVLLGFAGKKHIVYSGYFIKTENEQIENFEKTEVYFKNLSKEQIVSYIEKFPPYDKAGSYGIQDEVLVEKIVGDFHNVMGFPEKIFEDLKKVKIFKKTT